MSDNLAQLSEPMTLMRTKDVKHLADRIEELEAKAMKVSNAALLEKRRADKAEAKLAKAVGALEKLNVGEGWAAQIARTTLAELTGGKDA